VRKTVGNQLLTEAFKSRVCKHDDMMVAVAVLSVGFGTGGRAWYDEYEKAGLARGVSGQTHLNNGLHDGSLESYLLVIEYYLIKFIKITAVNQVLVF